MKRYGKVGFPLLYFPTSAGDCSEFGSYGLEDDFAPWIRAERVQVFSMDGHGPDTLFNPDLEPARRIETYAAFEQSVANTLLPSLLEETGADTIGVVGASYGAFVAANLLFKQYERVEIACGLGGVYQMWHRLDGYHDDAVYFHTPLEYMPRLEDEAILSGIRRTRGLVMYGAQDDEWLETTYQMQTVLREKRIPHTVDVWSSPANHHEHWWKQQVRHFLARHFPLSPK